MKKQNDYYEPPFKLTDEIINLTLEIAELIGSITTYESMNPNPILRHESRIRSVYSSLAIEQNTLTLEQVTDVINGKRILGPPQDIQEVKNAYEAYEKLSNLDPYNVKNLLLAHKMLMNGLVKEVGIFRSGNVGIYDGTKLVHAGSPANYVPDLTQQLLSWLKNSSMHPLIKSCIFHYEFEFIHPFQDGNGRTGRLWQSLILQKWKNIFAWLPIETLVHENQKKYYEVLGYADSQGESTEFVKFMLEMIKNALVEISKKQNDDKVKSDLTSNEDRIITLLKQDSKLSTSVIASTLGITQRQVQRIIDTLKKEGMVVRHGTSRNGYWEIIE